MEEEEGCSKTSAGAAASDLPDVLLVEILSRVPAKSVCRFKCVSKAWRDLIADPHNRKKLRQPMQGLFVQTYQESEADHDESEADDDASEADDDKLARMSFDFINLIGGSMPLDIDPYFSFLTEMAGIKAFLLDSCNGLVLFGHRLEQFHTLYGYIVCNPTTRQWSVVSACGSLAALHGTYLAFDPAVSSHFHLVQFQMHDEVLSLHVYSSETGSWSQNQIDEQKEQGQLEGWRHKFILDRYIADHLHAFVNGFLHVIVWHSGREHILVVDIQGKARRIITVPDMADGIISQSRPIYLGQSQGHLNCVTRESADGNSSKIFIWVLQDYDTQEWVLKNTVSFKSLDVFEETEFLEFSVVDIHQDCNVIFFLQLSKSYNCKLIAYDMDRKEVNDLATFKGHQCPSYFARYVPYFLESSALTNKY